MANPSSRGNGVRRPDRPGDGSRTRPRLPAQRMPSRPPGLPGGAVRTQLTVWRSVTVALSVVLVLTVVTAGLFGYRAWSAHQMREAHREAVAAARQVVVDFLTVSAASVTRDTQRVLDNSTGDLRRMYQAELSDVRRAVIENKVAATGRVLRSGLVSGDADSAVVLVAADVRITNVNSPQGRKAYYRIQVDMAYDEHRDRWLASRLEFVGAG